MGFGRYDPRALLFREQLVLELIVRRFDFADLAEV